MLINKGFEKFLLLVIDNFNNVCSFPTKFKKQLIIYKSDIVEVFIIIKYLI